MALLCSLMLRAQHIEKFVNGQMETYPESRLLDIYKSCFQDFMGAEHLVSNTQAVKAYLDEELETTTLDELLPWYYEPCGIDSNYYRVSIRNIKENIISEYLLLDAFVRSANTKTRPSVESWKERWHQIIGTIDQMQLDLPHYDEDRLFIDSILSAGKYAISHSPSYREAYHPHYRIVERSIFEKEIKPFIKVTVKNKAMQKIYDFKALTSKGKELDFSTFEGKVLLIVNTASKCGFTPQFAGLEELNQKYKDKGLVVVGFPCNQFKEQDPGTDEQIVEFCQLNYGVTFQIMKKIDVNGPAADPIFEYLKAQAPTEEYHGLKAKAAKALFKTISNSVEKDSDIQWNFTKFLISKDGETIKRYAPTTEPKDFEQDIEAMLD